MNLGEFVSTFFPHQHFLKVLEPLTECSVGQAMPDE